MAISNTSRYQRNATTLVRDRRGRQQLAILRREPQAQRLLISDHLWRPAERVDHVASRYFATESSWWMFAEANPHVMDWTVPVAGTRVMVPRGLA